MTRIALAATIMAAMLAGTSHWGQPVARPEPPKGYHAGDVVCGTPEAAAATAALQQIGGTRPMAGCSFKGVGINDPR